MLDLTRIEMPIMHNSLDLDNDGNNGKNRKKKQRKNHFFLKFK